MKAEFFQNNFECKMVKFGFRFREYQTIKQRGIDSMLQFKK